MKEEADSLVDRAEQYAKINAELYTLKITGKVATVVASTFSRLIILLLVILVLFLLVMGLAYWVGDKYGNDYMGFFIVGGICAVVTLIAYLFRYPLIRKPVMDTLISEILK
jgi:hypothetical protein